MDVDEDTMMWTAYVAIGLLILELIRLFKNWYMKFCGVFIPRNKTTPKLIGLHISHYVEKVRWTLDLLDVDYIEIDRYAVLGVLLKGETLPILQIDSRTTIGDSVDILHYLAGKYPSSDKVNLSIDSLSSEDRELLEKLDSKLGVHLRRYLYGGLLQEKPELVAKLWSSGTSSMEQLLSPILFPISKFLLIGMLKITPKGIEQSKIKMDEILEEIDERLLMQSKNSDNNKKIQYLSDNTGEEKLSVLDITFCSLVAPLLAEPLYGRGDILPTLEELGPKLHNELLPYQSRPFAKYVHRVYQELRLPATTSTNQEKKNK